MLNFSSYAIWLNDISAKKFPSRLNMNFFLVTNGSTSTNDDHRKFRYEKNFDSDNCDCSDDD